MPFDLDGARTAGYSDAELASYLAEQQGFDLDGARAAGYSESEVLDFLASTTERPRADTGAAVDVPGRQVSAQKLGMPAEQPGRFNIARGIAERAADLVGGAGVT